MSLHMSTKMSEKKSLEPHSVVAGKIGIVGTGVMGSALIQGLLNGGCVASQNLWAAAKSDGTCSKVRKAFDIAAFTALDPDVLADTSVVIVCVKPHQAAGVFQALKDSGVKPSTLILSVVAGTSIKTIEGLLGSSNPLIRAMPNTPCVVGEGMTIISPSLNASPADIQIAQRIFESVGVCLELEESHFDAVTGLSGSGPAYLFLIMEALADGGVRVGLPRGVALKIVAQTVLGAAKMVLATGRHPADLRDDVTTPAGCTIAALLALEDGKIRSVLARAVEEATRTASQLGQGKVG